MPEARRLKDWLTSYMEYNHNTEPPLAYHKWCGMFAIAAAMQRKVWTIWEEPTYPSFYIILVGPPGKCRKGTAIAPTKRMLRKLEIPLAADREIYEALITKFHNSLAEHETNEEPKKKVLHCSVSVIAPELTVFLDRKDEKMLSGLLTWYDCPDNWAYNTKHQGSPVIDNLFINLLGGSTPNLIATAMPENTVGGGLVSRIIFVYADRCPKTVTFPIKTRQEKLLYDDLYHDLEVINSLCGQMRFTPCYLERWRHFYEVENIENPPMLSPQLVDYHHRRPTHIRKTAMAVSVSESNALIITGAHLQRAIDELSKIERRMSGVFINYGRLRDAAEINRLILRISCMPPGSSINKWLLYDEFKLDLEPIRFDATLDYLSESKQITLLISGSNTTITNICTRAPGENNGRE